MMMLFVFFLDIMQNLYGFFYRGRIHDYLLESAVERSVLFNVLTVLVECCCADTLDFSAGKGRLEHIRGIQRARCTTGTDDSVYFVNEENHVRRLLQFVHHCFHTLFKLTTVLRAGNERRQVKGDDTFVEQYP